MREYRYEVVENPFHGGGHIAYAKNLYTACNTARKHDCEKYGCHCGGPRVRHIDGSDLTGREWNALAEAASHPHKRKEILEKFN